MVSGRRASRARRRSKSVSIVADAASAKKRNAALALLIAAGTIGLYLPVIAYSFIVLDDRDYVTANFHVHHGLRWSTAKWAFTSTAAANWHPLTWLSHAFDCQLFRLNPAWHHLDSVLMHALNAVLLFLLLQWVTKRTGPSLLAAALFALDPINVESVAWVAERKNLLSTLFFISAIGAYVLYARKPDWRRYLLVAALFAAGLMSKPMVITLPCVLMLLDYWPLGRIAGCPQSDPSMPQWKIRRLLLEKIPLLFLSGASAVITLKVQHSGYAVRSLQQFPIAIRIENALVAYVLYLWKTVWPAQLALYPHSAIAIPAWQWILSALVLIGVSAAVVVFRRKRYLPVGWFWFLGTLVPVIGLVQVGEASMADRYAYIPLIGIFIIIAWGLADLAGAKEVPTAWQAIPATCVLVALAFVSHRQMNYWESDYKLWAHALEVNQRNPFAHDAMGSALLDPNFVMTPSDDENLSTQQGRMNAARQHFDEALDLRRELARQNPAAYLPDMANTLNNLGNLDRVENQAANARQHYEEALNIHRELTRQNLEPYPADMALTLNNLGTLQLSTMQVEEARQNFEGALGIYRQLAQHDPDAFLPNVAETLNNLGSAERSERRMQDATQHYEEALQIRRHLAQQDPEAYLPYLALTLNDLGVLDGIQNRADEARQHYEEALKTYRQLAQQKPDLFRPYVAAALSNLAFLDQHHNQIEASRAYYLEALSLYQGLSHADPDRYSGDVARVDASLQELEQSAPAK